MGLDTDISNWPVSSLECYREQSAKPGPSSPAAAVIRLLGPRDPWANEHVTHCLEKFWSLTFERLAGSWRRAAFCPEKC